MRTIILTLAFFWQAVTALAGNLNDYAWLSHPGALAADPDTKETLLVIFTFPKW
jgi:hypothetical protein